MDTKKQGTKTSFAREDHVHDLDKDVVERNNFNDDVIKNLLGSDNKTISISVDKNDNKKINIITSPATTVSSVMDTKKQGIKTSFAREDHVHDLAENVVKRGNFNEDVITNFLVSDETIKIEKDVQNKVIKLSTVSGTMLASKTGVKKLEVIEGNSISDRINPGLGPGPICVVLGLEEGENEPILIGSHEVFLDGPKVLLGARVDPNDGTFEIGIKAEKGTYRVRWWAFKAVEGISVSIMPNTVTLNPGGTEQFTAEVTGIEDQEVLWEATGGTIDKNGNYTAPENTGTFYVTATSKAYPSIRDMATVTVIKGDVSISINPSGVCLFINDKYVREVKPYEVLGKYWESLDEKNTWGGSWTTFKDAPHFERSY